MKHFFLIFIETCKTLLQYPYSKKIKTKPKNTEAYICQDLPLQYGIIDYVNKKNHVLHIINTDSTLIFFRGKHKKLTKGSYVQYHYLVQII